MAIETNDPICLALANIARMDGRADEFAAALVAAPSIAVLQERFMSTPTPAAPKATLKPTSYFAMLNVKAR